MKKMLTANWEGNKWIRVCFGEGPEGLNQTSSLIDSLRQVSQHYTERNGVFLILEKERSMTRTDAEWVRILRREKMVLGGAIPYRFNRNDIRESFPLYV